MYVRDNLLINIYPALNVFFF